MNFENSYSMLIDGELEKGSAHFAVVDPATERVIAQAPDATQGDLDRAVAAARRAFAGWAATPMAERRDSLKRAAQVLVDHVDDLTRLLTREQGKPLGQADGEIRGASYWLQTIADLDLPVIVKEDSAERYAETRYVPVGVIGAIAPWNFPIMLAMFKVGQALLAGNTVVLKPSPFTPLTTLKFGELVKGLLPPGVLNVLSGGDDLGPWMTSHPGIDKISFTGSTATGRRVMASAAPTLKRVTLELGGNDAAIVMPDVDVAKVVPQIFWAAFLNSGQVCVAIKRVYVHEEIYSSFKSEFLAYARTVKVGNGLDEGTQLGPICNRPQYDRLLSMIADARQQGYNIEMSTDEPGGPGYFLPVMVIDNPPEYSRIVREEQFGPVLPLLSFNDYDDVIDRVNATDYGLGASVWARDEDAALALARRIISGAVWINECMYMSPTMAFGGVKQSGIGVEGGIEGVLEYTNAQTIVRRK